LASLISSERFYPAKKVICFEGKKKDMKIIALEEHFRNAAIEEAVKKALPTSQRDFFVASMALSGPPELEDLGIDRLKHMDAMDSRIFFSHCRQNSIQSLVSKYFFRFIGISIRSNYFGSINIFLNYLIVKDLLHPCL
jgi:hypothetical protein